jgi:hypothetical protein
LFLAEAIFAVDGLFRDHDEYGGIQADFVLHLDGLARNYFTKSAKAGAEEAAMLAREFRNEVKDKIARYNPSVEYDPLE